jgi:SAM-dependent methyltransferase
MQAGQEATHRPSRTASPHDFPRLFASQYADFDADLPLWLALAQRLGEPILELGCGPGRVLEALLKDGHFAIGLDRDWGMLLLAKEELCSRYGDRVPLIQADLGQFRMRRSFNLIIIACNTFAELADATAGAALACIRAHLALEGMLALDLPNPTQWPWEGSDEPLMSYTEPRSGNPVQLYAQQALETGGALCRVRWSYDELLPDGRVRRHEIRTNYHLRGPHQMRNLLREAGFSACQVYGGYRLQAYARTSQRLIVLASPSASASLPAPG